MGAGIGGFAKELPRVDVGIPCDGCGMEVASLNRRPISGATCVWCSPVGPARSRRAERLAKRRTGVRK